MSALYYLESNCVGFSGRLSSHPGEMMVYLKVDEESALQTILDLFKQGFAPDGILEYLGEAFVLRYFNQQNW